MEKKKYLSMAIACGLLLSSSSVWAAENAAEATNEAVAEGTELAAPAVADFGDEDLVVTATRTQVKDVDIPAATEIITAEMLKNSGATSAMDALKMVNGIQYDCIGSNNSNMGTMTNDVIIRGYKDGTLILLNGMPISYRGKYDLSAIDARNIERIEVIKAGGSVLYGSEAVGGVVNIILKKDAPQNSVTVGVGNRSAYNYNINLGADNWRASYSKSMMGKMHDVSSPAVTSKAELRYFNRDLSKENFNFSMALNDKWDIMYNYAENIGYYDRYITDTLKGYKGKAGVGDLYQSRRYDTLNHNMQVSFHDKNWKVAFYNNINFIESKGFTDKFKYEGTPYHTRERNNTYGLDTQNTWNMSSKAALTAGFSAQRESYNSYTTETTTKRSNFDRNNWAVFAQLDQKLDEKNSLLLGARETWTTGAFDNKNYSNFSMSGSWLHKMDQDNNLYATIAQSFIMPTFSQMYKSTDMAQPNPDLKPQKGINYEIGWKQNHGSHSWKAAIFHMDVTDNITATWDTTDPANKFYQYNNVDFRNTGLELSCKIDGGDKWSYHYGLTWQHPQSKSDVAKKGEMMGKWEDIYGRFQLNGGIGYKYKKLISNLEFSYMCSRYESQSGPNQPVKPYLLSSLNFIYAPDKNNELSLSVNNLLSRRDRTSNSSSNYYCTPATVMLNYTFKW